ncbi:MAG: PhnD/SsuA/transferrin family substrate-binding protein [Acidobacteriota bacterium]|nr:PhnD/SsuA/transferrin family substrate-binding protein [Acidobacteriota bacterium]
MTADRIQLGAVAYDPKVVTIWDGFRRWLRQRDLFMDYVLYSHYEHQVEDLVAGRIDVAWNSPLAWVRTQRMAPGAEALVMRDTDLDLTSVVVVRADSEVRDVADLAGRLVAVGAVDSPQATLIPLGLMSDVAVRVRRFDVGVGLHGDHIGGERDALRALAAGEVEAACLIDTNHLAFSTQGVVAAGSTRIVAQTPPYDHCNMTAAGPPSPAVRRFCDLLLAMDYADPQVRPLLDLEGLRQWVPGRTSGYAQLARAVDRLGFYGPGGEVTADGYRP